MEYKAKIYLSGGFETNWQDKVITNLKDKFIFFNPRMHSLEHSDFYSTWDIHFVKNCDIFFAYMESANPSGYGLSFELGIAYALNKTIILIDEKSENNKNFAKYFKIMHRPSGVVLKDLNKGIEYLKKFAP